MEVPEDHSGIEILSAEECDRLLESTPIGRVAFVDGGDIHVLPVTYRMHEGLIVFRTDRGTKLSHAGRHGAVSFEVDHWDPTTRTGWSVLVKGAAVEVDEDAGLLALGLHPWADPSSRRAWITIRPDDVTGRRIP